MHRKKKANKFVVHLGMDSTLSTTKIPKEAHKHVSVNKNQVVPVNEKNDIVEQINSESCNSIFEETNQNPNSYIESYSIYVLPYSYGNILMLSNTISESKQAFVITDEKCLVIIAKILCDEGEGLIAGCSICQSDFMFNMERHHSKKDLSALLSCSHTKIAFGFYLKVIGSWKSQVKQPDLEKIMLESMSEPITSQTVFINENHSDFCGSIILNYGLFLFIRKMDVWRCVACQERKFHKCIHGQLTNLPYTDEFLLEKSNIPPIGKSKNLVKTSKNVCSKFCDSAKKSLIGVTTS